MVNHQYLTFFNGKWSKFGSGKIMHYNMAHHDMAHSMKARNFVDKMGYSMISYGKRMRIIHDFLNLLLWEKKISSVKIPQLLISTTFTISLIQHVYILLYFLLTNLYQKTIFESTFRYCKGRVRFNLSIFYKIQ